MYKNKLIRIYIFVLVICVVFASLPLSVSADLSEPPRFMVSGEETSKLSNYVDTNELRDYLIPEFQSFKDTIDISKFNIPYSAVDDLRQFIWREIPECFHVGSLKVYITDPVPSLLVEYEYTKSEYDKMFSDCKKEADKLLDGIKGNSALSDVQKALLIHDRLAAHNEYDYFHPDTYSEKYTMYAALVSKCSVCDGYTKAYAYLLRQVGIECINCLSQSLGHSWNLVKIDGQYYHVDVTWDDHAWKQGDHGVYGYVTHTNFLRSNSGIGTNHKASDFYAPATSTKYDSYFWQSSNAEFKLVGGNIYYIDSDKQQLMRLNSDGKSGTSIYSVSSKWPAGKGSYWTGNFSRLDSDGHLLFFTTADTVCVYDPATGATDIALKPALDKYESIFGFSYSDGYLVLQINTTPNDEANLRIIKELYVPSDITAKLSSTVKLSSKQTVTATVESSNGVSGYYFGKKAAYTNADTVASTKTKLELNVTEAGKYYFVAFDKNGRASDPVTLTFCLVELHPQGGTLDCEKILTVKENVFALPTPTRNNYDFVGWSYAPDTDFGIPELLIENPPDYSEYYAIWKSKQTATKKVTGKITVKNGVQVTVACTDADGNILSHTVTKNGEFSLNIAEGTKYIAVIADNYVTMLFTPAKEGDTVINTALKLLGDVNGDGKSNNKDVKLLFKYVSHKYEITDDSLFDFNSDGKVDNKDVSLLFSYVSGL